MITLEGIARTPGIAIAVAAVVDAKTGINGVSHTLLRTGLSALMKGLPAKDYPEAVVACDSLAIGAATRVPGIQTVAIAAESPTDAPEISLEVPCVTGVSDLLISLKEGDILIVDGYRGVVHIDPDPQTLIHYQQAEEQKHTRSKVFITSEHIPARTQSGETVLVYAKMSGQGSLSAALDYGADGLLVDVRGRSDIQDLSSRVLQEVAGKPVTFVVDLEFDEILRAAMLYCTPLQVTLVSGNPELLEAQVELAMDSITLEALQMDLEAPQVSLAADEMPFVASTEDIESLVASGARAIVVEPDMVPEAKLAIRSVGLAEDAD